VATEFVYPLLFQSYTGVALMPVLPRLTLDCRPPIGAFALVNPDR
jgi:hypothetical protein